MTTLPVALTVAGSDSGGGAGIQADLKTFEALGVFGTSAITAITAQNTREVRSVHEVPVETIRDQIDAVVDDLRPAAAKTGMLSSTPIIRVVADALARHRLTTVVDPVMVAKSGARLLRDDAIDALKNDLLPLAHVVTPNLPEAEALTGLTIRSPDDAETALGRLRDLGPRAVLLKGGHAQGDEVTDLLHDGTRTLRLTSPRIPTRNTHGTGCTLAAGVAAGLAKGHDLEASVRDAHDLLQCGILHALAIGGGNGPVHHLARLRNDAARSGTLDAVRRAVQRFQDEDLADLVPEIGTNLAACTPYPRGVDDVAAVQGRIVRLRAGPGAPLRARAAGDVAFGTSRHVAHLLLALRAHDASVGAAVNLRYDDRVQQAMRALSWDVVAFDRAEEPADVKQREGSTLTWAAQRVMRTRAHAPDAIVDGGEVGKEPVVRVLSTDPDAVVAKAIELGRAMHDATTG